MKTRLKGINVTQEQPQTFMAHLQQETKMQETRACRFAYDRLSSLLKTLNVTDLDEFTPLGLVTNFTTLVSTYAEGFSVYVISCSGQVLFHCLTLLLVLCGLCYAVM